MTTNVAIEKFVSNRVTSNLSHKERITLYNLFPDQYETTIKKSIDTISKSLEDGLISQDTFTKALKNLSHLVPKKVQVKGKDGKVHMAIRWMDPTTGEAEVVTPVKMNLSGAGEIGEKVMNIISSGASQAEKMKSLFNEGIYDDKVISLLVGIAPYHVRQQLAKLDVDMSSLPKVNNDKILNEVRDQQSHNSTPEDIEANTLVNETRNVKELWENYAKNLKRVISGRHKFAICYGRGGVGKSFTCERLLGPKDDENPDAFEFREFDDEVQPNRDQYDYVTVKGKISPSQVYAEMYRHRDKLIIFDDCDHFLSMDEVQGFLKGGLDTGVNTKISNKSPKKMYNIEGDKESGEIPNTFRFTGRVIAITNLTAEDIDEAVFSRALTSNLTMTIDETLSQLTEIKDKVKVYNADKTAVIPIRQEARDIAFEFLQEYKSIVADKTNTRVLGNAMLMVEEGFIDGTPIDRVKREVKAYYDAINNTFGKQQAISRLQAKGK